MVVGRASQYATEGGTLKQSKGSTVDNWLLSFARESERSIISVCALNLRHKIISHLCSLFCTTSSSVNSSYYKKGFYRNARESKYCADFANDEMWDVGARYEYTQYLEILEQGGAGERSSIFSKFDETSKHISSESPQFLLTILLLRSTIFPPSGGLSAPSTFY